MGLCGGSAEFFRGGGVMANQKKPFHEVLSTKLDIAVFRLSRNLRTEKEVKVILDVLLASKMPASVAHQMAEYFTNLPSLLATAGWDNLSQSAAKVLADLRGREDEKKEKVVEEEPFVFPL